MKYFLIVFITVISSRAAFACPDFSGFYSGTCKVVFYGTEMQRTVPIVFIQKDCDKFIFNDLSQNPKFYNLDKSAMYEEHESKYLRRASVFDNGSTAVLQETLVKESPKYGNELQSGIVTFKKLSDDAISYESERFDLLKSEVSIVTSCPELKRQKN